MARERREVFGEVAQLYDGARPGYPGALFKDVLDYAGAIDAALEVGAGTGKASLAFAAHGLRLVCLEPDPRMASILLHQSKTFPSVSVEIAQFENYRPATRFDLLIAAQSWHWVDETIRWDLAHETLHKGGALALFWNKFALADQGLQMSLAQVDRRYGVDHLGYTPTERHFGDYSVRMPEEEGWPSVDLADDSRFTDFQNRRYRSSTVLTTKKYLDLLSSISVYRLIDDDQRQKLFTEVGIIIDAAGGSLTLGIVTDLFMGRTAK